MNTDYCIIMPPPNITGVLHMGHVLNMTLQDVLIRRARAAGKRVCWYPGLDHAAIATENKVIDDLKKKGINKSSLSRDGFLSYCWQWKDKYGSDGVRFGLLLSTQAGNDLKYEERLCKLGRNFITKIKNAHKLLMLWKERQDDAVAMTTADKNAIESFKDKLQQAKADVDDKFKEYKINEAAMILYKLVWDDFCSTYLEAIKKNFDKKMNSSVVNKSFSFFNELMALLHPFIPSATEEMTTE